MLVATILGSSLSFIDGSAIGVALPSLQKELGIRIADVQWIVEAYALFFASLLLLGGSLGDRFGRRKLFALGVLVFAAGSAWCGFSTNTAALIAGRAIQGIGAALVAPNSLAIISAAFPENERGRAIGIWSALTSVAAAAGPLLGGWVVEYVSWRWLFFINMPVIVAILLAIPKVPESKDEDARGGLDWVGPLLATLGLGAFVYGLIQSSTLGLSSPVVIAGCVGGLIALALFVLVEARVTSPMVPIGIFKSRTFTGVNLLTLSLYAGLSVIFFYLPFNLIQVRGYSPTAAGAALLPMILMMFVFSGSAGKAADRYGAKPLLIIGPMVEAVGFWLLAQAPKHASFWVSIFPASLVVGLGMAISVAPLTATVMSSVPKGNIGIASGLTILSLRQPSSWPSPLLEPLCSWCSATSWRIVSIAWPCPVRWNGRCWPKQAL